MGGYMGKLLVVDLTSGKLNDEPLDPALAHDFVGGAGYAARWVAVNITSSSRLPWDDGFQRGFQLSLADKKLQRDSHRPERVATERVGT